MLEITIKIVSGETKVGVQVNVKPTNPLEAEILEWIRIKSLIQAMAVTTHGAEMIEVDPKSPTAMAALRNRMDNL